MDADLYQEQILDRYRTPRHEGEIKHATVAAEGANRSCGDELTIWLRVVNGRIAEASFRARACAVCTASTDLLLDRIIGQRSSIISELTADDIQKLIGLPLSPMRLKCALLPLQTLKAQETTSGTSAQ